MRPTTLHITVGDREQLREDALQVAREIDDAASPTETSRPDGIDERSVLQFGSYDDLVANLTSLRLELLRAIRDHEPASMREAARLVDRDVSDVHTDLERLAALDILEFEEGGHGGAKRPVVPYDRIEMHVDYPLLESGDADDTPASAD